MALASSIAIAQVDKVFVLGAITRYMLATP